MSWWRRGALYQVYPRSFQDSDGDGVGDLAGVRRRLPYLKWLGVDAVWLSPFYASPMADFGYDISDHCAVDPRFGTLEDFDALAAEARSLGLELILDYVPNHTSDRHPWFTERPDFYLWRDEPNNWRSVFGGPAWQERDGRVYYHAYLSEQPDLNWRNPAVREEMLRVLRFWLDRGVGGFRIDALRQMIKDDQWRDNPPNPDWDGTDPYHALIPEYTTDRPEVRDVVAAIRAAVGPDTFLLGELYLPYERLMAYYGYGLDLPANFHLLSTPWRAAELAELIERYEAALPDGAWPNWVLGNHDRSRIATRVGAAQARVAAMLLLTLRGTPTLYYGDEIGMTDVPIQRYDPDGRDPERTPMQWDRDGGFTTGEPWLPYGDLSTNVADEPPILTLHRRLLALRRDFAEAGYRTLHAADGVLAYARGDDVAVALNLTAEPRPLPVRGGLLLSTHLDAGADELRADEGIVLRL
jgi:alpha-glucosidase